MTLQLGNTAQSSIPHLKAGLHVSDLVAKKEHVRDRYFRDTTRVTGLYQLP